MVTTTTGCQAIETISIGDYVLAYHEVEGSLDYYPVLAVWAHEDPVIIELVVDGEAIFTTPDHPFYTEQGDWLPAAELQVGDEIRQADWDSGTVETITFIASPQTMYNFTVATAHIELWDSRMAAGETAWPPSNFQLWANAFLGPSQVELSSIPQAGFARYAGSLSRLGSIVFNSTTWQAAWDSVWDND